MYWVQPIQNCVVWKRKTLFLVSFIPPSRLMDQNQSSDRKIQQRNAVKLRLCQALEGLSFSLVTLSHFSLNEDTRLWKEKTINYSNLTTVLASPVHFLQMSTGLCTFNIVLLLL